MQATPVQARGRRAARAAVASPSRRTKAGSRVARGVGVPNGYSAARRGIYRSNRRGQHDERARDQTRIVGELSEMSNERGGGVMSSMTKARSIVGGAVRRFMRDQRGTETLEWGL